MLRELKANELNMISAAGSFDEVYPAKIPGYEIVGWTQEIIGYDSVVWVENKGLFDKIEHVHTTPIYQILPIYSPVVTTVVYY